MHWVSRKVDESNYSIKYYYHFCNILLATCINFIHNVVTFWNKAQTHWSLANYNSHYIYRESACWFPRTTETCITANTSNNAYIRVLYNCWNACMLTRLRWIQLDVLVVENIVLCLLMLCSLLESYNTKFFPQSYGSLNSPPKFWYLSISPCQKIVFLIKLDVRFSCWRVMSF